MPDAMLHPEFETLTPEATRRVQDDKWARQWAYVLAASDFYRDALRGVSGKAVTLDGIAELPFTGKDELRLSQERLSPFGDHIACGADRVVRVHRTSGTTGRALQVANSRRDVDTIARIGGRSQFCAGLRPGDRVVHCLNYCMWTGGVTDHMTLEETGACVVPFGVGNTRLLLDTIADLGVTAISCTPSYPALLEKLLRGEGRDPRELKLRLGLFGGEAGLDNIEFRQSMEDVWGFGVRNANYGMSEVMSNFASQCEHSNDLHFHGADAVFVELIDAAGSAVSIREGAVGELVCTHVEKECQPLLRYRTRDVVTVTGTGPCDCGRTTWRFRVTGRTDDMFNVRGINVFPTAVQTGVMSRPDLASGQFRIVLAGAGPWDRIVVRAEAAHGLDAADYAGAARALEAAIRQHAGASAEVTLLPPDSLPRTDGKTALIERTPS
ncbi:phenylacetate--CoA ligase family protein [Aureimonas flava]|uniref:Phenylacetate--CoA ligase family protein n=1 Tax=Aureimonas flava TaxID=2320271 RepID=A0A3A1WPX6_9HYPH|nr:AMP-binding protein [Aureimonas flava]RIY02803.1 phenylacetate--CoA ligase family protein [Aureimonas flava]